MKEKNCPLCDLVDRIRNHTVSIKPWQKKIGKLILEGKEYTPAKNYKKNWKDIVLHLDNEFLFVSSIRNKGNLRHGVVCLPLKHISKKELRKPENSSFLAKFDKAIIDFIKKNYKSVGENVRVLENFGSLASVPDHAHKQILYTKSKGLHITYKPIKYN